MISLPPHPNVVRMYGVSIDGPQPIIVMEYFAGETLEQLLWDKEEEISDEQKIRMAREIAKGICHLHTHTRYRSWRPCCTQYFSHSSLSNHGPSQSVRLWIVATFTTKCK